MHHRTGFLSLVAGLGLYVLTAYSTLAQTVQPERVGLSADRLSRVAELIDRQIEAGEISGAVTLVARNGQIAYLEAQGASDLASGAPMRADTIFRIASMSKPVAGVAIMMLVEKGKVRVADSVSRFLPSFAHSQVAIAQGPAGVSGAPDAEFSTVPAEREITVFDLLTHTSGVMSGATSNRLGRELSNRRHELGLAWVDSLGEVPLEFQPGSRWSYSALAGFDILSRIVEIASGQTFREFLDERIFAPLDMNDTFFWPTRAQRERIVTSYTLSDGALTERENPDSMSGERYFSGAGGLMTTARDYAQFAMMLASGGSLNGVRLLAPRTVECMGSMHISDELPGRSAGEGYGLSVRVVGDPVARGTMLSAGSFGWSGAYGTHFWVDPKENLVGIMMIQTPIRAMRPDFENAVMQAVVE
jgi:CubicO group peptidase (beta-lactamase class C family)